MKHIWNGIQMVWKKWLALARIMGNVQLRIIFSVFYVIGFSVLGILFRFFQDPLGIRLKGINKKSAFSPWGHPRETLIQARKPF